MTMSTLVPLVVDEPRWDEVEVLSPGVSRCRGCRAVSGGVEAVSRQCRLTPVSVCRAVSGCSVGAVSGLLDSGDVRIVSRCQAVSECRSVGVSGCRTGVEVLECRCPTQTASNLAVHRQIDIQTVHHHAAQPCCTTMPNPPPLGCFSKI